MYQITPIQLLIFAFMAGALALVVRDWWARP